MGDGIFPAEKTTKGGNVLKDYGTLRAEIIRLTLEYLRDILRDDTADYGDYRVEDGEFRFCPKDGMHLPADRVSEWSLTKSGGGKVRFDISVKDGNILLSDSEKSVYYWGKQGK